MCIISFYRKKDEFILTHNRDEEINRKSSNQILKQTRYGKIYFSPVDEEAKGTWIFYSEDYIACILNGGEEKVTEVKGDYKESRGNILLYLLKYSTVKDYIEKENFSGIAPFTIFVFERKTDKTYLLHWNEKVIKVKDLTNEDIITWCSSTLYSEEQRNEIDYKYKELKIVTSEEIKELHNKLKMEKGTIHESLATTSISQIIMNSLGIKMKYCQLFSN